MRSHLGIEVEGKTKRTIKTRNQVKRYCVSCGRVFLPEVDENGNRTKTCKSCLKKIDKLCRADGSKKRPGKCEKIEIR